MDSLREWQYSVGDYHIQEIQQDDAVSLCGIVNDAEVKYWMKALGEIYGRNDVEEFIRMFIVAAEEGRGVLMSIKCDDNPELVGFLGICDLLFDPTLFYALAPGFRGLGIMTSFVRALTEFLHRKLGKNLVRASVNYENIKSLAVMERCGFIDSSEDGDFQHFL